MNISIQFNNSAFELNLDVQDKKENVFELGHDTNQHRQISVGFKKKLFVKN